jgi:nicotinamide riboside kinase
VADDPAGRPSPRIAIVGPCASGKSTLVHRLRKEGWDARMPAQEHSGVRDMWRKLVDPDILVVLDARDEVLQARRPDVDLASDYLATERRRLAHAREHADLVIDTSDLSPEQVYLHLIAWLASNGLIDK